MSLMVQGLGRDFAGVTALNDVSFATKRGAITAVIGPNGAGKTTLINLISGHLFATRGQLTLDDVDISRLSPHRRARSGIARTFQRSRVFADMTVAENMVLGQYRERVGTLPFQGLRRLQQQAAQVLDEQNLTGLRNAVAEDLSHGDQRRVEIARALVARPAVLLLDEPAAGMSADERAVLKADLLALRDRGLEILLVEHDLDLVMSVADDVVVLDFGSVIARGRPEAVTKVPDVQRAYMGSVDA